MSFCHVPSWWTWHCFICFSVVERTEIQTLSDLWAMQPLWVKTRWVATYVGKRMVCVVLWLVLANPLLHDSSESWRFITDLLAGLCCLSLDPSGITSPRNRRIKDSSQKPAEVSGGHGDFCFGACGFVSVFQFLPAVHLQTWSRPQDDLMLKL